MNISYKDKKEILKQVDTIKYADVVIECKSISEERKSQFLDTASLDYLRSITNIKEFSEQFYEFYQWNSPVFTPEIHNAYNDLLDDSYYYKWNISITHIVKCIEDINSVGVVYIPPNFGVLCSILTIQANIGVYFREELITIIVNTGRFKETESVFLPVLVNGFNFKPHLDNFIDRREYHKKNSASGNGQTRQTETDEDLNEWYDRTESASENNSPEEAWQETKKLTRKIEKGRMETKYLAMLFEITEFDPGCNDVEKYTNFYPLLQLLLHDKTGKGEIYNLYTKDEFNERVIESTGDTIYYDGDYNKYQHEIVERILGL
jgi:hypothetical protein